MKYDAITIKKTTEIQFGMHNNKHRCTAVYRLKFT